MNDVLTPTEVAKKLRVHRDTVLRWLREGRLPGQKLGYRTWRITEDNIREFLERERKRTQKG